VQRVTKSTPHPDRRLLNTIGIVAIVLVVVFYILEVANVIDFLTWIILVLAVFLVANLLYRQIKKRQQLKQL
jgi:Flp pilus assembly protein TadB